MALTKSYRALLVASWLCYIVAVVLLSTLSGDVDVAVGGYAVGYPVLLGVGAGISFATTYFPVLAPLPVEENARALACFAFLRSFASVRSSFPSILIFRRLTMAWLRFAGLVLLNRHRHPPNAAHSTPPARIRRAVPRGRRRCVLHHPRPRQRRRAVTGAGQRGVRGELAGGVARHGRGRRRRIGGIIVHEGPAAAYAG